MSNIPIRFRPRQGEKRQENSSVRLVECALTCWTQRIKTVFSHYVTHLTIVLLAVLVFSIGPFNLSADYELIQRATPTTAPSMGSRQISTSLSARDGSVRNQEYDPLEYETPTRSALPATTVQSLVANALLQSPVVHTTIPNRLRRDVITHTVVKGDTVLSIAAQFGLEQDTVIWANPALEQNPHLLRPGQEIAILPIDGVYHTVVKGDTLEKIAKKYEAGLEDILKCPYNHFDPDNPQVAVGQKVMVPGGIKPYVNYSRQAAQYSGAVPADAKRGSGLFEWPTAGRLTDRFGFRTFSGRWHGGLDISSYKGAPVYAADSGFVTFAGWSDTGYGNLVIIDHQNGFETRYAHLSAYFVTPGQSVTKGGQIGTVGSTGNSTGPHLHFEVRFKGVRKDPEAYLP